MNSVTDDCIPVTREALVTFIKMMDRHVDKLHKEFMSQDRILRQARERLEEITKNPLTKIVP
jgi:hypothetical protein